MNFRQLLKEVEETPEEEPEPPKSSFFFKNQDRNTLN